MGNIKNRQARVGSVYGEQASAVSREPDGGGLFALEIDVALGICGYIDAKEKNNRKENAYRSERDPEPCPLYPPSFGGVHTFVEKCA